MTAICTFPMEPTSTEGRTCLALHHPNEPTRESPLFLDTGDLPFTGNEGPGMDHEFNAFAHDRKC